MQTITWWYFQTYECHISIQFYHTLELLSDILFFRLLLNCPLQQVLAAAAAKLLQSCLTLCNPIDPPPDSAVPGILQARTLEWVAISFSNAWKWNVKVKSLSRVRLLATPSTAAYQTPPSMGFSRQEYWSGVPLPSPNEFLVAGKHHCLELINELKLRDSIWWTSYSQFSVTLKSILCTKLYWTKNQPFLQVKLPVWLWEDYTTLWTSVSLIVNENICTKWS